MNKIFNIQNFVIAGVIALAVVAVAHNPETQFFQEPQTIQAQSLTVT